MVLQNFDCCFWFFVFLLGHHPEQHTFASQLIVVLFLFCFPFSWVFVFVFLAQVLFLFSSIIVWATMWELLLGSLLVLFIFCLSFKQVLFLAPLTMVKCFLLFFHGTIWSSAFFCSPLLFLFLFLTGFIVFGFWHLSFLILFFLPSPLNNCHR